MIYSLMLTAVLILSMYICRGRIVSPHYMFSLFYAMVYLGWYLFVLLINEFVDYKLSSDIVDYVMLLSLCFYFVYSVVYFFLSKTPRLVVHNSSVLLSKETVARSYKLFLFIGLAGISLFVWQNGIVLFKVSEGGYEQKNIANAGSGLARILYSVGFSYFIACRLILFPSKIYSSIIYSILIGVIIFYSVGGGRATSLFPLAICMFYLIFKQRVSIFKISVGVVLFFAVILLTTIIRYGIVFEDVDNVLIASIIYKLQGSFSPADSVGVLIQEYQTYLRYPEAIFNNLYYFVPRFIWPDKPLILLNASGYFTSQILNYPVELTISTTLVGEFLVYGGFVGVFVGAILTAFFIKFYDLIFETANKDVFFMIWYLISFLNFFALLREGLALVVRDLILSVAISIFAIFVFHILKIVSDDFKLKL